MDISQELLSDITVHMKYARFLPKEQRRETWEEIVTRNMSMHIKKFPGLEEEIKAAYVPVFAKEDLPSMRSLQFAGKPIEISPNRMYNCGYCPVDSWEVFAEIMFLLLGGTGVGYSVQTHHVKRLPEIRKNKRRKRYLVPDSIEGWSEAVKQLTKAYFTGSALPEFDFRDIRSKGALLVTSGGKAPGPEPLKDCLHNITKIFDRKEAGDKLTTLEAHDIICYIADAVLAGGIRRAALISFFDFDDEDMLTCKFGNWYEQNGQRARANNSAVILRHKIKEDDFFEFWKKIELSGSGEPGIFFTNDKEMLGNPCVEISLKPYQFCNLVEINGSNIKSQEDLNTRAKSAAFIGTLQASYTNFHYLRDVWQETTEKEALLGIGLTGIASGSLFNYSLEEAAAVAMKENARVARLIGINKAARVTCVKPSGTSSLVLGTSSGIHAWHDKYYLRRIRVGKNESIYTYLLINHPELLEDDYFKPTHQAIISVPQRAPKGAILRTESPISLLERVKKINHEWIKPGHRKGSNTHNVSCTVSVKTSEWPAVGKWMWENRDCYNGLAVLPYDGGTYVQAPFESITKDKFEELFSHLHAIDLSKIVELHDNTKLQGEISCGGAIGCEIV